MALTANDHILLWRACVPSVRAEVAGSCSTFAHQKADFNSLGLVITVTARLT